MKARLLSWRANSFATNQVREIVLAIITRKQEWHSTLIKALPTQRRLQSNKHECTKLELDKIRGGAGWAKAYEIAIWFNGDDFAKSTYVRIHNSAETFSGHLDQIRLVNFLERKEECCYKVLFENLATNLNGSEILFLLTKPFNVKISVFYCAQKTPFLLSLVSIKIGALLGSILLTFSKIFTKNCGGLLYTGKYGVFSIEMNSVYNIEGLFNLQEHSNHDLQYKDVSSYLFSLSLKPT